MAVARVLVAVVLAVAFLSQADAQLALCVKGKVPAAPKNVRIQSNKWDNNAKKAAVTIAFDNPTNGNTGCPTSYTIKMVNSKGTALGGKHSLSNPISSPITQTYYLSPAEVYSVQSVALNGADGKSAYSIANMRIRPQGAGITPFTTGRKMI